MDLINAPIELALPSDNRLQELESENNRLREQLSLKDARISGLVMRNEALQRRVADTINQWKVIQGKLRTHEVSDILTDYISEWYHSDLLRFVMASCADGDFRPQSWNAVSEQLSQEVHENKNTLKLKCMALAQMTEEEWDALCLFKKTRNLRVHPRRNRGIVQRVMKEISSSILKTALSKMFNTMRGIR